MKKEKITVDTDNKLW